MSLAGSARQQRGEHLLCVVRTTDDLVARCSLSQRGTDAGSTAEQEGRNGGSRKAARPATAVLNGAFVLCWALLAAFSSPLAEEQRGRRNAHLPAPPATGEPRLASTRTAPASPRSWAARARRIGRSQPVRSSTPRALHRGAVVHAAVPESHDVDRLTGSPIPTPRYDGSTGYTAFGHGHRAQTPSTLQDGLPGRGNGGECFEDLSDEDEDEGEYESLVWCYELSFVAILARNTGSMASCE